MRRALVLLPALFCILVTNAGAQRRQEPSTAPEFLQVKLGKSLSEQFPECRTYSIGTSEYDAWNGHDPDGFRCYQTLTGYVYDHNMAGYVGKDYDMEYKTAIAKTNDDSSMNDGKEPVGYVSIAYAMETFKETFAGLKAKRGQPTSCSTTAVQNLMGAHMTQIHCEWKQPWGRIAITAPSSDDLTMFDVWAVTNHHIQLRRQEFLANKKKTEKDF